MIIEPNLLTHMKFIRFKRKLPAAYQAQALEFLVALWAHCQGDQLGENWGRVEDDYLEDVCGWTGKPGELFAAMTAVLVPGKRAWVSRDEAGNLIVNGWNERNVNLIRNWSRNPGGNREARATATASGTAEEKPTAPPAAPPTANSTAHPVVNPVAHSVANSVAHPTAHPVGVAGDHPVGEPDDTPEESPSGGARGVPRGVGHGLPRGHPDKIREEKRREEERGDAREPAPAGHATGPSTAPPPPTFLPLDPKLFQRELRTMLETAKYELRRLPERPELTESRLSPEAADLIALLEREGNAGRARAVAADRLSWRTVLTDPGKRHQSAWKQRIAALEAALKGVIA